MEKRELNEGFEPLDELFELLENDLTHQERKIEPQEEVNDFVDYENARFYLLENGESRHSFLATRNGDSYRLEPLAEDIVGPLLADLTNAGLLNGYTRKIGEEASYRLKKDHIL